MRPDRVVVLAAGGGSRFDRRRPQAARTARRSNRSSNTPSRPPRSRRRAGARGHRRRRAARLGRRARRGHASCTTRDGPTARRRRWPPVVAAAEALGAEAVVVGLGDQPCITADGVAGASPRLDGTDRDRHLRRRARATPCASHRSVWPLLPTTGDEGARVVARLRPDLVEQVPCAGSPADIDTVEDLAQWQSRSSTNSP